MSTHSFDEYYHADEQFHAAKRELRYLIAQGVSSEQALKLVVALYNYPLMLHYYGSSLRAWSLQPAPVSPLAQEVKTYHEELQAALERIAVLEHELIAKNEETATPPQTPVLTSDSLLESEVTPLTLPEPILAPVQETTPTPQPVPPQGDSSSQGDKLPAQDTQQEKEVQPQEVIEATPIPVAPPDGALIGTDVDTLENVYILDSLRTSGVYDLGNTRTGKSTGVAAPLALHDAKRGAAVVLIAPEWSLIAAFLARCPEHRLPDVTLIELGNEKIEHSIGLNLITRSTKSVDADAARLMDIFMRLWGPESEKERQSWGPRMQNLLGMCILTFLYANLTLAELHYFLEDAEFRDKVIEKIPETEDTYDLRNYWAEYNKMSPHEQEVWRGPILNKVYNLVSSPALKKVIAQEETTLPLYDALEQKKIILVHINEDLVGSEVQRFWGTIFVAELIKAIRSRDLTVPHPFVSVVIDEFQRFESSEFQQALPECGKFSAGFCCLNQYLDQLQPKMQGAVQQMGIQITHKVGPKDAAIRAHYYARPPKPITREVEKKLPAKRCIDQLVLAGRPHTNDEVTLFFFGLEEVVRMDSRPTTTKPGGVTGYSEYISYPSRLGPKSYFKFHKTGYTPAEISPNGRSLEVINEFFFQVMKENNARLVFPRSELNLISLPHDLPMQLGKNMLGLPVAQEMAQTDGTPYTRFPLALLTDELYAALWQVTDDALPTVLKQCWEVVYSDIAERIKARVDSFAHDYLVTLDNNSEMVWHCCIPTERTYALAELPLNRQPLFATATYTYKRNEDGTDIWLDFEKNELTVPSVPDEYQEFDQEAIKKIIQRQLSEFFRSVKQVRITFLLNDPRFDPHTFTWQPHREHQAEQYGISRWVFGENEAFSTMFTDSIAQKAKEITDSFLYRFTETVRLTRRLCDALVADPIMVGTGEMEEIVTGKQPVQDAVNEMAGNIIDLPNYTAYISLSPHGGLGEKQTTAKPCVATLPLPDVADETILPARTEQAHAQTRAYATPNKDIEKAIKLRRAAYGIVIRPKKKTKAQQQQEEDRSNLEKQTIAETEHIEEKYPQGYKQQEIAAPVVAPAPLKVSRAGTYAAATLPLTPYAVALPVEKTTPDSYALILYHTAYATLDQAVALTGKKTSIDYERKKLNNLVKDGLATSELDKSGASSGKAKAVYSLTAKGYKYVEATQQLPPRKKGNLAADTLAVNDALITLVLAAREEQNTTLVDLQQEKVFEQATIKLPDGKELSPDGLVTFRVNGAARTLLIECDSGSEQKSQIFEKCSKYLQAFQGPYQERTGGDSVTVVFCIPHGVDRDIARLVGILETALKQHKEAAPLFLVGVLPDGKNIPNHLLTQATWSQPFSPDKHALIA